LSRTFPSLEELRTCLLLCFEIDEKERGGKQREVVLKEETFHLKQKTGKGEKISVKIRGGK